jgi:hypothetical protein
MQVQYRNNQYNPALPPASKNSCHRQAPIASWAWRSTGSQKANRFQIYPIITRLTIRLNI